MTPEHDETAWGFATRAIHAGQEPDPATGAVAVPIYQTSTFAQEGVGRHKGYEYARSGNPTRAALERCLASLESGTHGLAFSSGLGAESAVTYLLASGDHIVAHDDLYGGTSRLFNRLLAGFGVTVDYVDATDPANVARALRPATRLVWIETPTNPLLTVIDIAAVARRAHEVGALVVVDNTFATPWLQLPLTLGADVVVHSTTKYLGGHSDVVGGFAATNDADVAERLAFLQNASGAVPGPFDCFLVQRGVKTLAVRMERHCTSALAVVDALVRHAAVATVLHPSLPAHPGHDVATRQMRAYGGMVSFALRGGEAAALEVCRRTRIFTLAESLGAVESLIEHPARMTHASVAGSTNEVPGDLVRLSIGLETAGDLVADLEQALEGL
jgi:cystathionine gamma-synthase